MNLSGWGRTSRVACRIADFRGRLDERGPMIARGCGRAYGDAAMHPNMTLLTRRMDRLLDFDPQTGRLTCEAGVTLETVLAVFVPLGWFPPAVPGTRFVTIGGMAAADIHGKNHHEAGSFGCHVEALSLMLPDGHVVACVPGDDLFAATIGGMGLTGIIQTITFRLMRIPSPWIQREVVAAANLDETLDAFEQSAGWPYTVAWIDCLATGGKLGRSLLSRGAFAEHSAQLPPLRSMTMPFDLPSGIVNGWSVRAFNALYHARRPAAGLVPYGEFFFPLDGLLKWNRIYGRRGFAQYQCVLPERDGIRLLLEKVARSGLGSFLAVLKLLGPNSGGLLSFPMQGWTLALDFPMRQATLRLLDDLDAIVADHGGRLYLAKDCRMSAAMLRRTQPNIDRFQAIRAQWGCLGAMQSLLAERLEL